MFLDLVDSTPTAEQLDSQQYFGFIRDFIYFVSIALLEYKGRIYQYVGDEVVASWLAEPGKGDDCLRAVVLSERLIKRNGNYFRKTYGFIPEFRVGIHAGEVTVGEIGIIKKDLVMSGDTMNTTARIRESCTDLKHKCLLSKEFLTTTRLRWPTDEMGAVELRGKNDCIELYALK
jgi:adenylate cyclase